MSLFSTPKGRAAILAVLASGAIGFGAARWMAPATAPTTLDTGCKNILYWYDPMVPTQHFDKGGKSPFMDMELEPKCADTGDTASGKPGGTPGVMIDPAVAQNFGMRVVAAYPARASTGHGA